MSDPSQSIPLGGLAGLQNLLNGASQGGEGSLLSAQSSAILAGAASPLVAVGAAGYDITRAKVNEALNLFILIDTSVSMDGLEALVTAGQNAMLDALGKDPRRKEMMLSLWEFDTNVRVVHAPLPLNQASRYGAQCNYQAKGGSTSLFTSWEAMLAAAVAAHQYNETSPFPTPTTTACVVITDGGENGLYGMAKDKKAAELTTTLSDLLKSERFFFGFMGLDRTFKVGGDPKRTHFWTTAKEMGFPDGCIGVDADVVKVFARISSSMGSVSAGKVAPGASSSFFT